MSEQQNRPKFGQDELTMSLNDKRPGSGDGQKTEDWHADWSGKLVVGGQDLLRQPVPEERRVDSGQAERSACEEGRCRRRNTILTPSSATYSAPAVRPTSHRIAGRNFGN